MHFNCFLSAKKDPKVMLRSIKSAFCFIIMLSFSQPVFAGGIPEGANNSTPSHKKADSKSELSRNQNPESTMPKQNARNDSASGSGFVAIEDDPLIVDVSDISDNDGMGSAQIQWQISRDTKSWQSISGATQQSFTPREINVGQYLRVVISYVDGQGKLETIISPPSTKVQNVNDKPTGSPTLSGEAKEKSTLVVNTSLISDEDGIGSFDIIWQRSKTQNDWQKYPATNGGVLRLKQENVGYSFRAVVTYIDSQGTREVLVTSPSEVITNVDDPVQGEATIVGKPMEGGRLTADNSTIADLDGIASTDTTWQSSKEGRNWETISVVQPNTLILSQALVGKQIRLRVSVVDKFGIESILFSKPTTAVQNVNNKPAGKIIVRRVGS